MMRKKAQKKIVYAIAIQLIIIYCGMLIWALKFQSETSAAYNDIEHVSFQITADWTDKDDKEKGKDKPEKLSLSFIKHEVQCKHNAIVAVIKNNSQSSHMKNPAVFEVYWSEKGNPKPIYGGKKVHSGMIPALRAGESHTITFKVTTPGNYVFKVSYSNHDIWSNVLQVDKKCIGKYEDPKSKHQQTIETLHAENEKTFIEDEDLPSQTEPSEASREPEMLNEIQTEGKEGLSEDTPALD